MLKFMPEMLAKKQLTIAHVDVLQRKRFAKMHLGETQGSWKNLFWTDETKVEILAMIHTTTVS